MLAWELIGAAIGAGFASGREIAAFFAQYGRWGYAGIASAGIMLLLSGEPMPAAWRHHWQEKIWRAVLSVLLITTGGAMLAGAGEICERVVPIRWSYQIGMASTMIIGWLLAEKTKSGLALVSKGLTLALGIQLIKAFCVQPMEGASITAYGWQGAIASGMCYGGFNAALQWPIVAAAASSVKDKKRAVKISVMFILMLLTAGMILIRRHPAAMGEAMPFLVIMKRGGAEGYYTFVLNLYIAVLSSLTACIKACKGKHIHLIGMFIISCVRFDGVVNSLYPMLGGACCMMMLLAKVTNSLEGSFLSRKDMI